MESINFGGNAAAQAARLQQQANLAAGRDVTPRFGTGMAEMLKDPKQQQAFMEMLAMAFVVAGQLSQGWGGVAADPKQIEEYQKAQQQQLQWYQANVEATRQSMDYWKNMANVQMQMSAGIGFPLPGPQGFTPQMAFALGLTG